MPGPRVSHRRALAERRRAGQARPLPGCSRQRELAGTHICVPQTVKKAHCRGEHCSPVPVRPVRSFPERALLRQVGGRTMFAPTFSIRQSRCFLTYCGTHICVPYKLSGNVRAVYRGENTVGAGHARPAGVPQAGACGKVQGRACPAPTGVLAAARTCRDAYMRPLQTLREHPGRVQG